MRRHFYSIHTLTLSLTDSLIFAHALTHSLIFTFSYYHSLTDYHSLTHSLTITYSLSHARAHPVTHTPMFSHVTHILLCTLLYVHTHTTIDTCILLRIHTRTLILSHTLLDTDTHTPVYDCRKQRTQRHWRGLYKYALMMHVYIHTHYYFFNILSSTSIII